MSVTAEPSGNDDLFRKNSLGRIWLPQSGGVERLRKVGQTQDFTGIIRDYRLGHVLGSNDTGKSPPHLCRRRNLCPKVDKDQPQPTGGVQLAFLKRMNVSDVSQETPGVSDWHKRQG